MRNKQQHDLIVRVRCHEDIDPALADPETVGEEIIDGYNADVEPHRYSEDRREVEFVEAMWGDAGDVHLVDERTPEGARAVAAMSTDATANKAEGDSLAGRLRSLVSIFRDPDTAWDTPSHTAYKRAASDIEALLAWEHGRNTVAREEARRLRGVLHNHPRSEYVRMARGPAEFVIAALLGEK